MALIAVVPFVHPGIAGLALATGLIPILIHLINRRRFRRVPWAAMAFLLAANRRSTRRMRLEHWLLMLARIGVIVLLGLAIARPYVPANALLPVGSAPAHRVLVFDNSLSMAARAADGRTRYAAAMDYANALLTGFPPTDGVSLITMAAPAQAVISQESRDRRFVRDCLSQTTLTQRATDAAGSLALARTVLKESNAAPANRMVYVISDFARPTWSSDGPGNPTEAIRAARLVSDALADPATDLNLVRVELPVGPNAAITRLEPEATIIGVQLPTRIAVEVANRGTATARGVGLQVQSDGVIVRRETIPKLEPGESVVSLVTVEFTTAGTHPVEARLTPGSGDAIDTDDRRLLSVDVRERRGVLLVDGRPGIRLLDGQAGFLATALAPDVEAAGSESGPRGGDRRRPLHLFAPKVVAEAELERETLSLYEVVALCNVPRLSAAMWTGIRQFVADGGGLFIGAGDLLGAEHYSRFGSGDEGSLLPGKFGRVVQGTALPDGYVTVKAEPSPHVIVADFEGQPDSSLYRARVERYLAFESDPRTAEVVLRYSNDDPALVVGGLGKGRVVVWTTSVSMDWSNLPAKGDFVSLMHNIFTQLMPRRGEERNLLVGSTLQEPLAPTEASYALRVTSEDGATVEPPLAPLGEGLALRFGPLQKSQWLRIGIGPQTRTTAVNVDPAEADVVAVDDKRLAQLVDRPVRIVSDITARENQPVTARSMELASGALYAVLALLMVEMWLAARFGSQRDLPRELIR